jgi:hypothetical protein
MYTDHPTISEEILADPENPLYVGEDFWYSIGLRIDASGTLLDVRWGSLADHAKLAPKQKLLTVNGAAYSAAALHSALQAGLHDRNALRLTLQQDGELIPVDLDYHDGERFPTLKRSPSLTSYLDTITKPRSK